MSIEAARNAMSEGNLVEARKLLIAIFEQTPENPEIRYNLAMVLARLGDFSSAADHFVFCSQLVPDNVELLNNAGNALRLCDRLQEARKHLDKAVALAPDHVAAHCNRGWLLLRCKDFTGAISDFRAALKAQPDIEDPRRGLIDALSESKHYGEAQTALDDALRRFPNSSALHNSQGSLHVSRRRPDLAIGHFKQAITLAPDNPDALLNHGITSEQLGALAEAETSLTSALKIRPGHPSTQFHLAYLAGHRATPDEALAIQQALMHFKDVHDQTDLQFALGKTLAKLNRHKEAFPCFLAARYQLAKAQPYDINSVLAQFQAIAEAAPTPADEAPTKYLFVVGMPRSGTTLTDQILASHSQVQSVGESGAVGAALSQLNKLNYSPAEIVRLPEAEKTRLREFIEQALGVPATPGMIVDTSPGNFPYLGLLAYLLPNARFIHCSRNPLDTCVSIFEHPLSKAHAYANSLDDLGSYYRGYQKLMQHWESRLKNRLHTVVYEALLDEPEQEIRAMLDHCSLDFEERCLQFYDTDRAILTPSASAVRKPLTNTSVDRWRVYEEFLGPLINTLQ